jgi:hypothetical protein
MRVVSTGRPACDCRLIRMSLVLERTETLAAEIAASRPLPSRHSLSARSTDCCRPAMPVSSIST